MNKLHILITRFPFQSSLGGEELHTLHLAQALKDKGHEVTLFSSDPVLGELFEEHELPVWTATAIRPPVTLWTLIVFTLLSPLYFVYLNWFLVKFWLGHRKSGNKLVLYSLSLPEKLLMSPVAKLLGFKVAWIEHARIGGWLTKNPWVIIYFFWSFLSEIITPSEQTAYPIRWAQNIRVIPHGVIFDKAPFEVKKLGSHDDKSSDKAVDKPKKTGPKSENFKILCVARLSQDKGVDYLISALLKLTNHGVQATLKVVGSGPEEASLKKMVQELHLDRYIEFTGKVPHEELAEFFEESDTVVLPSTQHDPFGLVVIEAMIMKKPMILTSICGASEFLEDGVEALVVPAKDEHALYQALSALATNQDLRAEIAQKGHSAVSKKFSHDRMVRDYETLFLK